MNIRSNSSTLSQRLSLRKSKSTRRLLGVRILKKSRKRIVRYGLLAANVAILAGAVAFVAQAPTNTATKQNALIAAAGSEAIANPLDKLSSADIAVHVAQLAKLEETRSVTNNADTINAQLSVTPSDEKVIAKPQVVATALKSRKDIVEHVVMPNETITSIAAKYGITADSIRWSNDLSGDTVEVGKKLTVPPITGIVYTVKEDDTAQSLADRFRADKTMIIYFNDAEVDGLPVGEKIVIPEGLVVSSGSAGSSSGFAWAGYGAVYGGNGYDFGYCTWWAAQRRIESGRPLPSNLGHAISWKPLAEQAGMATGNVPRAGAVIWWPPGMAWTWLGHVGYVERVNPDGSILVSEMNAGGGWGQRSDTTYSAAEAARHSYIY